jgi:ribosome modulation factor
MEYKDNIFFKEGRGARRIGIKLADCPYSAPQIKELWCSGWSYETAKKLGACVHHKTITLEKESNKNKI